MLAPMAKFKFKGGTVVQHGRVADPEWVPIGDRLVLPERFYAIIEPDDPTLPICQLGCVVERGRPVCVDLRCSRRDGGGPPVTGEVLRQLPIATYTREATAAVCRRLVSDGDEVRAVPVIPELEPIEWRGDGTPVYSGHESKPIPEGERFAAQYAEWTGAPRRRGPLRDDDLRKVAEVYRGAHAARNPPTRAVAARFGVSRSTAGRWIGEARRRGHLGEAPRPRMAGEREADGNG
jgi:hypothetical protein